MRSLRSHIDAISSTRAMVRALSTKRNRRLEKFRVHVAISSKNGRLVRSFISKVKLDERYQRFSRKSIFNSVRILSPVPRGERISW